MMPVPAKTKKRKTEVKYKYTNESLRSKTLIGNKLNDEASRRKALNNISNSNFNTKIRQRQYTKKPTSITKDTQNLAKNGNIKKDEFEYALDVFNYLFSMENEYVFKKWPCELSKERSNIVNWLISVSINLKLRQETIHLAVSLLDKFITQEETNIKLTAISCLSLSVKYEEIIPVSFIHILSTIGNTVRDFSKKEQEVVLKLDFNLATPSTVYFLRRMSMFTNPNPLQHTISKLLIDVTLYDSYFCCVKRSMIAAGALYIAICIVQKKSSGVWSQSLIECTKYTEEELKPIVSRIALDVIEASENFNCVIEKYSSAKFFCAVQNLFKEITVLRQLSIV